MSAEPSLVLVLVFEGFVDALSHGFAMEDEAFGDRRLHTKKNIRQLENTLTYAEEVLTMLGS